MRGEARRGEERRGEERRGEERRGEERRGEERRGEERRGEERRGEERRGECQHKRTGSRAAREHAVSAFLDTKFPSQEVKVSGSVAGPARWCMTQLERAHSSTLEARLGGHDSVGRPA